MTTKRVRTVLLSTLVLWILSRDFMCCDGTSVRVVEKKTEPPVREASVYVVVSDPGDGNNQQPGDTINKDKDKQDVTTGKFTPLPFPVDFRYYDVNRNGEITLRELIEVTGRAENVNKAFAASDLNGDGRVTVDEYTQVPWGYEQNDIVYKHD